MTTRLPASPNFRSSMISWIASAASALGLRDDHAFAERESVGFDDERISRLSGRNCCASALSEKLPERRGRDAVALHEFLGENLRRFEPRGALGRTEDAQAVRLKKIDDAGGERVVRADDGEVDALVLGELRRASACSVILSGTFGGELRDAGIAGRAEDGA